MQEKNQSECLKALQEREQQESLALEELELQKKAIQSECDKKVQEMHQEVETCRTVSKDSKRLSIYKYVFNCDRFTNGDLLWLGFAELKWRKFNILPCDSAASSFL